MSPTGVPAESTGATNEKTAAVAPMPIESVRMRQRRAGRPRQLPPRAFHVEPDALHRAASRNGTFIDDGGRHVV
jgi:hypothetical protein